MAGHVLTLTLSSDVNTDAIQITEELLKLYGWDDNQDPDPVLFLRKKIRMWAKNDLIMMLRQDAEAEAEQAIAAGLFEIE